ncbi:hypothetical protein SBV1_1530035 [Verrucomicrobia bacterium]|nr:hypothetical protein SBV1_1530035 [Verrucomicrobiota bacterium]
MTVMSEHQIEIAFLRHIVLYDDRDECCKLEKSIVQVRRDTHCVQRVASVTALFPLLALTGVAYGSFLQKNFPYNMSEPVLRLLCVLGLSSLICLVGFAVLLAVYLKKLHRLRKEVRKLVLRHLESRPGKAQIPTSPRSHRGFDEREASQGGMEFNV